MVAFKQCLLSIFIALSCITLIHGSETGSNTEDQYFIFNESVSSEDHIFCNAGANCYISCIGDDSCHNLVLAPGGVQFVTINAENANYLYLECIGEESCARMNVIPPQHGNVHIECNKNTTDINAHGACEWLKLRGTAVRNATVHCQKIKDCYSIDIDLHRTNSLNIHFSAPQSGYNAHLRILNVSHSLNVICNGNESCKEATVFCAARSLCNIQCINESSCAAMTYYIPSTTYDTLTISCMDENQEHTHCFEMNNIYCQDTQQSSPLTYNIYTQQLSCHDRCCPFDADELSIEGCEDTNDTCVVDCSTTLCDGKIIHGESKTALTVICVENGNSSCNGLHVFCPLHGTCLVQCDVRLGCTNLKVQHNAHVSTDAHVVVLCSNDASCRRINITAPYAYSVVVNASAYHSLSDGEIHVENVHSFELFCYNKEDEYHDFKACLMNEVFVSDNVVDITCMGQSCGDLYFYVSDRWSATDNMNLNIVSKCECGTDWIDCMELIGIFCTKHNNIPYSEFSVIKDGNCSDLCGCHHLVGNIQNNYIGDDLETDMCEEESQDYHIVNTDRVKLNATLAVQTSSESGRKEAASTMTAIVIIAVILCGGILFLACYIERKKQKQIHGFHVRQQSHTNVEDDVVIDDREMN